MNEIDIAGVRRFLGENSLIVSLVALLFVVLMLRNDLAEKSHYLFLLYFIISLVFRLDSRYPIGGAIALLFFTAILLVQEKEDFANQIAIYAYYFLVIGVVLQIADYVRGDEETAFEEKSVKAVEIPAAKSSDEKPRCIAIASGKGGVGKTTIAANLGVALSKMGRKATVVDLDLAMPNLEIITGLRTPPVGLVDVLEGKLDLSRVTYIGPEGVKIIPPGIMLEGHRKNLEKIRSILKDITENNDYTILDMPPGREAIDLFSQNIETLLIVNPNKPAILDALNMKVLLEKRGSRVIGAVLNRAEGDVDGWIEEIEKTLEVYVVGVIPESREVKEAFSADECFVSITPKCESSREIMWLAEEIIRISLIEDYPEDREKA
jgi:septum site-determining protein MinD